MRFMAFCADRLVLLLNPAVGDKVLDATCGTDLATLAASQAVGPSGRVVAIDSADNMLERLEGDVGLVDVCVQPVQLGYHLRDVQEWWEVVWHSSLRLLAERAPKDQRERFQAEHLAEVASLINADGLKLDVPILIARGRVPERVGALPV